MDVLIDTCVAVTGSLSKASQLREFGEIAKKLCHGCYRQDWYFKSGGCLGISHLCSKMPVTWVIAHEVQFVKALLYVLKVR
jgi:transformation/transcription domain-associated protein